VKCNVKSGIYRESWIIRSEQNSFILCLYSFVFRDNRLF